MAQRKKIEWIETTRRGTNQPLLVVDGVMESYRTKLWGASHKVNWNPTHYRQFDGARWFSKENIKEYTRVLQEGEQQRRGYLLRTAQVYSRRIQRHRAFVNQYHKVDFSSKSNRYLANIFTRWFDIMRSFWCFGYDYIFINKFLPDEVIAEVVEREHDLLKQNEYLGVLFTADELSEQWQEKKSLIELTQLIKKRRWRFTDQLIAQHIQKHLTKFAHLGFYYFRGKSYSKDIILERLRDYRSLPPTKLKAKFLDLKKQQANIEDSRMLIRKLSLDIETVRKIKIIKRWGALSNQVDETYGYAVYHFWPLWNEIRKRLGLKTVAEFASLRGGEIICNLRMKKVPESLRQIAKQRLRDHAIIFESGKVSVLSGRDLVRYRKREQKKRETYGSVKELHGQAASPGLVKGRVIIVYSIHDLDKVERGNIMVTDATNPTCVPAMERSAAIVTDEGGLLCHAAIVSRELKVPCVVGTAIGTKALKDGDIVEVDATRGIIKIL